MIRHSLHLVLTLAVLTTPAAFGMRYASSNATPIFTVPGNLINPAVNNFSGCSSDSNTVAVGVDVYAGGFRMLCADAGRIGFWTAPVASILVGQDAQSHHRYLCPSGTALAGLQFIDGLIFPFPLCGELIPDLVNGTVSRTVLYSVNGTVVAKLSKTGDPLGVVSCGPAGFVQTLKASRDAAGNVNGFGSVCNAIVTDPLGPKYHHVDLAVKTINQTAELGRNATQVFNVNVYNLGTVPVPASNITLELRFDGEAWQVLPFNMACTAILAHSGVVDRIVVGERCTLPSGTGVRGDVVPVSFHLEPLGPDITRPATTTPAPILSVRAILINEILEGADGDATNDTAAFPQILR